MPPYRPEIPPPPSESWLPVFMFAGFILIWIAAILLPVIQALMEME